jgi:mono/diheme cytochrome c family protein
MGPLAPSRGRPTPGLADRIPPVPRAFRSPRRSAKLLPLTIAAAGLVAFAGCDTNENADLERGRDLFSTRCGTCHALAQAGTSVEIGPDLDAAFADARASGMDNDTIEGVVQAQIANPRTVEETDPEYDRTFMPADLVTGQDAEDVAAYVASVAGVPGIQPPPLGEPPEVFTALCGSCHTLQEAGTAGAVGPDLDEVLPGKSAQQIEEDIVDPDAQIAQGFDPGVMPGNFEQQLAEDNALQRLVQYLMDSVSGGGGGAGGGSGG